MKIEDNLITASGPIGVLEAQALIDAMTEDTIYTLDFSEVSEIKFAALRALLNCRRSGRRFSIVNASDSVVERFEDSGISAFINICRKPKPLDIGKYSEFGASYLSKAYNSADGDSMLKIYGPNVPRQIVMQEKVTARAVMLFGIPTPLVGTVYLDGDRTALDFERIEGKRSFSRIMADEPERLEEMSRRFARMCKELHSTPCDTAIFNDRSLFYRQAAVNCRELSSEERQKLLDFINATPLSTTCLHGDMQMSNVITSPSGDMWIDLADFGYGNPLFDLGMLYFQVKYSPEHIVKNLFHFGRETMLQVWDYFKQEYFGADTPEKSAAADAAVEPFCVLHMTYLGTNFGFVPGMAENVKAKIAELF